MLGMLVEGAGLTSATTGGAGISTGFVVGATLASSFAGSGEVGTAGRGCTLETGGGRITDGLGLASGSAAG